MELECRSLVAGASAGHPQLLRCSLHLRLLPLAKVHFVHVHRPVTRAPRQTRTPAYFPLRQVQLAQVSCSGVERKLVGAAHWAACLRRERVFSAWRCPWQAPTAVPQATAQDAAAFLSAA